MKINPCRNLVCLSLLAAFGFSARAQAAYPSVPAHIEAENYISMSGVQSEATTDVGGGLDVGYIDTGDYMDYGVHVATAGTYTLKLRVSSLYTYGVIHLYVNGTAVGSGIPVPQTGGWQTYTTVSTTLNLNAGDQVIRLGADTGGYNVNWLEINSPVSGTNPSGPNPAPPTSVTPVTIPSHIEAENFVASNNVQTEITGDAGGGKDVGYIYAGSYMDYSINVPAAGTYPVSLRVSSLSGGGVLQLLSNGNAVSGNISIPTTGAWQTYTTVNTSVALPAGQQTLRIYSVSAGWNINWLEFAASSVTLPAHIEAEDFVASNNVQTEITTDTGGGKDVGYIYAGSYMDYRVTVPAPGTYGVNLRVSSQMGGGLIQILADGIAVSGNVPVPITGNWQTYTTISTTVNLQAGQQTLRVYSVQAGWNLNWLEFTAPVASPNPGGSPTPAPTSTPASPSSLHVEAENYMASHNVQTEPTTDIGGGKDVGYIYAGSYMDYSINIPVAGTYRASLRVSSQPGGGSLQLLSNGTSVSSNISVPTTGGWQTYTTINTQISLPAGPQTLRVYSVSAGWNLNWFELTATGASAPTPTPSSTPVSNPTPAPSATATPAPSPSTQAQRIAIRRDMVYNETPAGDAFLMFDETGLGDPAAGNAGTPTTLWDPGWNSQFLPASAVVDFGVNYNITEIDYYDGSGGGAVTFSSGSPLNWTTQITDSMSQNGVWIVKKVNFNTRYLQIAIPNHNAPVEVVIKGTPLGLIPPIPAATSHQYPLMQEFIGGNAFGDDPTDKLQAFGTIREYHNWGWDEGNWNPSYPGYPNNQNKFSPDESGFDFDNYYTTLKTAGVIVSPALQNSVNWLTGTDDAGKPVPASANTLDPNSYVAHADHMFQFLARYGSTPVSTSLLKLASGQPVKTGMGVLKYMEDWNEQDKWWTGNAADHFSPYEYSAMASADFDGHQGTMGKTVGMKNADPNAKMVMAGIADANLEYVRAMKLWADAKRGGSFPMDVINIHHYASTYDLTGSSSSQSGISPEADHMKDLALKFVNYRNTYLKNQEVWVSEFGWDTHPSSTQRAPAIGPNSQEEVQAEWLIRGFLALSAAGVDKAHMYMFRDVDTNSSTQYDNSGIVGPRAGGYVPKAAYYYVYTLKNRLTGMRFNQEVSTGNPNVMAYRYQNDAGTASAYVVWAPTSSATVVNNFVLPLQAGEKSAKLVTLTKGQTNGAESAMSVSNGSVTLQVSERPVIVVTGP